MVGDSEFIPVTWPRGDTEMAGLGQNTGPGVSENRTRPKLVREKRRVMRCDHSTSNSATCVHFFAPSGKKEGTKERKGKERVGGSGGVISNLRPD